MRGLTQSGWMGAVCLAACTAWAQQPDPRAYFLGLVAESPGVVAARARLAGAGAMQDGAGRLPNPSVEAMYAQRQGVDGDVPMWEVIAQQPLPRRGERAAERAQAVADTRVAAGEHALAAAATAAEAARLLAEAESARRREALLEFRIHLTDLVLASEDTRVGAGQGAASERLALAREGAALKQMALRESQMVADAEWAVAALLGLDSTNALPAFVAPTMAEVMGDRRGEPAVALAVHREEAARAKAAMAETEGRSMTAAAVRVEREEMASGDEDTVGVALMMELPWGGRARSQAAAAAARADGEASRHEAEEEQRTSRARLEQARRAEAVADAVRALAVQSEAGLDAEYRAWLTQSSLGGSDGMGLRKRLDLLEKQTDVRRQVVEAEGAARVARAALWLNMSHHLLLEKEGTP